MAVVNAYPLGPAEQLHHNLSVKSKLPSRVDPGSPVCAGPRAKPSAIEVNYMHVERNGL